MVSLDVGCVRVTERFLASDPPSGAELAAARAHVGALLRGVRSKRPGFGSEATTLVGLAGTVSALAVLFLGLSVYDRSAVHHLRLPQAGVRRLLAELAAVPVRQRRERTGMEPARADVIVGGAVVLDTVMDELGFDELLVSESDILDGMVSEMLGATRERRTGSG